MIFRAEIERDKNGRFVRILKNLWKLAFVVKSIIIIVLLFALDFIGSKFAERVSKPNVPSAIMHEIDWNQSGVQNCSIGRVFLIYRHQTCYDVIAWGDNEEDWSASLFYHKPRPILHHSRIFLSTSYYFGELIYGERLVSFPYIKVNEK